MLGQQLRGEQWCSFSVQQSDVWSSQGVVGSLVGMAMGLWFDPACHESDGDETRPFALRGQNTAPARRRYCGARRRFVHDQNRNTQRRGRYYALQMRGTLGIPGGILIFPPLCWQSAGGVGLGFPCHSVNMFPSIAFTCVFPAAEPIRSEVGVGAEFERVFRSHIFDSCSSSWNRIFTKFPIFLDVCGSSGWPGAMIRFCKVSNYIKIGN